MEVLLKVNLLRNRGKVKQEITEAQSRFITGNGIREGIFNLRTICERFLECNKDVYLCFKDYEKTFDRVSHGKMTECLKKLDIAGKDLRLIKNVYWNKKAYIRTDEGLAPEMSLRKGVMQGCVFPLVFSIYTQKISLDPLKKRYKLK